MADTLDQSQELQSTGKPCAGFWQSFTTGPSTSQISKVELMLSTGGPQSGTITINIREGEGDTGTILGSASATPARDLTREWVAWTFATPIALSPNTKYTIDCTGALNGNWMLKESNVYSGGRSEWDASWDYTFRTYYTTGSEISTDIKSINGLAYADTKSVNGVAKADMKSFNGLE